MPGEAYTPSMSPKGGLIAKGELYSSIHIHAELVVLKCYGIKVFVIEMKI